MCPQSFRSGRRQTKCIKCIYPIQPKLNNGFPPACLWSPLVQRPHSVLFYERSVANLYIDQRHSSTKWAPASASTIYASAERCHASYQQWTQRLDCITRNGTKHVSSYWILYLIIFYEELCISICLSQFQFTGFVFILFQFIFRAIYLRSERNSISVASIMRAPLAHSLSPSFSFFCSVNVLCFRCLEIINKPVIERYCL